MDAMPASVRNLTIRILEGLFNFGTKRGHCAENPCKKLDISRRDAVEIEIHTPAEIAAILSAAEKHDPQLVPFLAVSFSAESGWPKLRASIGPPSTCTRTL